MIFGDSVINWTWYLEVTINPDNTVTIHRHWRMHNERHDNHPAISGSFRLIEDSERTVKTAILQGVEYPVTNQKNVFDYK